MYDKLLMLWIKLQPWVEKAYSWSPFVCGIVLGYLLSKIF